MFEGCPSSDHAVCGAIPRLAFARVKWQNMIRTEFLNPAVLISKMWPEHVHRKTALEVVTLSPVPTLLRSDTH